jgi:hypothetical protein
LIEARLAGLARPARPEVIDMGFRLIPRHST